MEGRFLWLLRHGKAAAEPPAGGGDRDRPLVKRGRRDATALGEALDQGAGPFRPGTAVPPEVVLCSPAVRTRQTAELLIAGSGRRLTLEERSALYAAGVSTALGIVRGIADDPRSALVVGHNPTMYELVLALLPDPDVEGSGGTVDEAAMAAAARSREALFSRGFPTCALAALWLPVDSWDQSTAGTAELRGLFSPPY